MCGGGGVGALRSLLMTMRVNAKAPSSPPVATRMVEGERWMVIKAFMLLWWILIRVCGLFS